MSDSLCNRTCSTFVQPRLLFNKAKFVDISPGDTQLHFLPELLAPRHQSHGRFFEITL